MAKTIKTFGDADCWLWTGSKNPKGYGQLQLGARGQGLILAHRASWQVFKGEIPDDLCVLHKCDTPSCVNPDHLWLGTKAENTADMMAKGRHRTAPPKNPNHHKTVSDDQVKEIRNRVQSGESQASVGRSLRRGSGYICRIVNRQLRKDVE